jgi:hypothetical protein
MVHNSLLLPWVCIGDFNTTLGSHEVRSNHVPAKLPMDEFAAWSDSINLLHLPTKGTQFTWINGRQGRNCTEKRLDRALCNQAMINNCASISCSTLAKHKSDHFPLLLDIHFNALMYASNFEFLKMWSHHSECFNFISQVWSTQVFGSPMQKLSQKLKILKGELKTWNKNVFGDINNEVQNAVANLDVIQKYISTDGYTESLMKQVALAKESLEKALNIEEIFWQQKSWVKWHCQGDRNTTFFHRISKIKQAYKKLNSIRVDNNIVIEPDLIANHVVNHFTTLFSDNNTTIDTGLVEEVIPKLINDNTNNLLTMLPSLMEIKNAVFSMNKDGAPGPYGFGAFFFQTYWEITKTDVFEVVLEFFQFNWIMPNFNANTVVLIPKDSNADTVTHFRPIA